MARPKPTHIDDATSVGLRLREAREQAGLSQRRLAFPGCSPGYISRIEAGDRVPSLQLVRELARRLGVSEEYLAMGDGASHAAALIVEADVALRLDERGTAQALLDEALAAAERDEDRARALCGLGQLAFLEGKPPRAIELLESGRALSPTVDDPSLADTLGRAHAALGALDAAEAVFREGLERAVAAGDRMEQVRFGVLLANTYVDATRYGEAEELLGRTLALTREDHDPITQARLLWSQSRLHTARQNAAAAARYARKALDLLELTEHDAYAARAHHLLAFVELDRGRPAEALELLRRGVARLGNASPLDVARFRLEEARALAQLGELEEAAQLALANGPRLAEADRFEAGRNFAALAEVFAGLGERERALELYELAAELTPEGPARYRADVLAALGGLLENDGRLDDALRVYKEAALARRDEARAAG